MKKIRRIKMNVLVPKGYDLLQDGDVIKKGDIYTKDEGITWYENKNIDREYNVMRHWPTARIIKENGAENDNNNIGYPTYGYKNKENNMHNLAGPLLVKMIFDGNVGQIRELVVESVKREIITEVREDLKKEIVQEVLSEIKKPDFSNVLGKSEKPAIESKTCIDIEEKEIHEVNNSPNRSQPVLVNYNQLEEEEEIVFEKLLKSEELQPNAFDSPKENLLEIPKNLVAAPQKTIDTQNDIAEISKDSLTILDKSVEIQKSATTAQKDTSKHQKKNVVYLPNGKKRIKIETRKEIDEKPIKDEKPKKKRGRPKKVVDIEPQKKLEQPEEKLEGLKNGLSGGEIATVPGRLDSDKKQEIEAAVTKNKEPTVEVCIDSHEEHEVEAETQGMAEEKEEKEEGEGKDSQNELENQRKIDAIFAQVPVQKAARLYLASGRRKQFDRGFRTKGEASDWINSLPGVQRKGFLFYIEGIDARFRIIVKSGKVIE